jgi:hypothetical protein
MRLSDGRLHNGTIRGPHVDELDYEALIVTIVGTLDPSSRRAHVSIKSCWASVMSLQWRWRGGSSTFPCGHAWTFKVLESFKTLWFRSHAFGWFCIDQRMSWQVISLWLEQSCWRSDPLTRGCAYQYRKQYCMFRIFIKTCIGEVMNKWITYPTGKNRHWNFCIVQAPPK